MIHDILEGAESEAFQDGRCHQDVYMGKRSLVEVVLGVHECCHKPATKQLHNDKIDAFMNVCDYHAALIISKLGLDKVRVVCYNGEAKIASKLN